MVFVKSLDIILEAMMSLERMRSLLNRNGRNLSDEQLLIIRTFFYQLAEIECDHYFRKLNEDEKKKSAPNRNHGTLDKFI